MNNSPRIEGSPDPRDIGKLGQKDTVNTEQFKKILRVDKSDESEQKNKRNLKKSEEGEEEDVEESDEINTPQTLFSELMQNHQKTNNLFNIEGGKKQDLTSSADTKAAPDSSSNTAKISPSSKTKESFDNLNDSFRNQESNKKEKKAPLTSSPKKKEEIEKKEETPPQFSSSKDESRSFKNPTSPPPQKTKEALAPIAEKTSQVSKEAEESVSIPTEMEKPIQFLSINASSDLAVSSLEKEKKTKLEDSNEGKEDSESRAKKEKEGAAENIQITPDSTPGMVTEGISNIENPAYASLSPNLFELFEQMVGFITIEYSNKGISTTTIKLSMPGSVFHDCEIKLEHYDTAPHSFNVQLLGTPEAVESFSSNLSRLVASFDQQKYPFSVNIQNPSLLKKEEALFKRKDPIKNDPF